MASLRWNILRLLCDCFFVHFWLLNEAKKVTFIKYVMSQKLEGYIQRY